MTIRHQAMVNPKNVNSFENSSLKAKCTERKLRTVFRSSLSRYLKRKVFNHCFLPVLIYGSETLKMTKNIPSIHVIQHKMERSLLGITLRDKIPIRINTRIRVEGARWSDDTRTHWKQDAYRTGPEIMSKYEKGFCRTVDSIG